MTDRDSSPQIDSVPPPLPVDPDHLRGEDVAAFAAHLAAIGKAIAKGSICPAGIYARKGKPAFRILKEEAMQRLPFVGDDWGPVEQDGWFIYLAKRSGYVILNPEQQVAILDPMRVSDDRMRLEFLALPLTRGASAASDALLQCAGVDPESRLLDATEERECDRLRAALSVPQPTWILVKEGTRARPGQDGAVEVCIRQSDRPDAANENAIDYHEVSPFQEIQRGTVIAVRTLAIPGEAGCDVFGEALSVPEVTEAVWTPGENVEEVPEPAGVQYRAAIDGILEWTAEGAAVRPDLQIQGDVDAHTGNLHFSGDIMVDGSVTAGFAIDCGGNLTVRGSIENGATIECAGDLAVGKGLFGEKSTVRVGGSATLGFIQDSALVCSGDMTVEDYIYGSHVTCKGSLTVRGRSIKSETKGAVVGGTVNALRSMKLHSAGSAFARTELACGVALHLLEPIREVRELLGVLTKKIARRQSRISIDLQAPDAAAQLAKLPAHEKSVIKQVLVELRQLTTEREAAQSRLDTLEVEAVAEDLNACAIEIDHHLEPIVVARIGMSARELIDRVSAIRISHGELGIEVTAVPGVSKGRGR